MKELNFSSLTSDKTLMPRIAQKYSSNINCPVAAIHGDCDPDPPDGVNLPLSQNIKDFRFTLIPKCGHKPWIEKHARDAFFVALKKELAQL